MEDSYRLSMHGEVSLLFHLANADTILLPDEIANIYQHVRVAYKERWFTEEEVTLAMQNPMPLQRAIRQVRTHPIEDKLLLLEFLALNCTFNGEVKWEEQQVIQTIIAGLFHDKEDVAIQFIENILERQAIFDAFGIPLSGMDSIH
ncbi:MAG: hypothetical protein VX278_17440 [Myxococcota bacterium]|nr:hypothetical protein [Myxococcota bacterium]